MNYEKEKARGKIPFKITLKKTKSLRINLMREVQDLDCGNYRPLMRKLNMI